jgi:zinc protease
VRHALALTALLLFSTVARAQDHVGPEHPRELEYPPLRFEAPNPADHRLVLENGLTAYLVPDRTLPVVRVRVLARAGAAFDPAEKEGRAALLFRALPVCGAGKLAPEALATKLDGLAATIEGHAAVETAMLEAWFPRASLEPGLDLLAKILRDPKLEETRLAKVKTELVAELNSEDDDAHKLVLERARGAIFRDHPLARHATGATVEKLDRDDVVKLAKELLVPGGLVLAIAGDFDRAELAKLLERRLGDWKGDRPQTRDLPKVPAPEKEPLLVIDRPVDQSTVILARQGPRPDDAELPAILIADHLLGSGSFTSRVVARVRSDEGLSYNIGSSLEDGVGAPGLIRFDFGARATDVSFALSLVFEELRRFAKDGPSDAELASAKEAFVAAYPSRFATPFATACELADNHQAGLADDTLAALPKKIAALDRETVRRAASRWFDPASMKVVIVGPEALVSKNAARGTKLEELGEVEVEK